MRSKIDGSGSNRDDLQTATTQHTSDFDQLLNDDAALLDFMVSTLVGLITLTITRPTQVFFAASFYRAMHFSAKRGIAIACCMSVCLSVRLSVCDV